MFQIICRRQIESNFSKPVAHKLVATLALEVCRAGSAGVSLLNTNQPATGFEWIAVAGLAFELEGCNSPRHDSACGNAIDSSQALLLTNPSQRFPWMQQLPLYMHELLVTPMRVASHEPLGTVWAAHHVASDNFDASDLRYLSLLSQLLTTQFEPSGGRSSA
jgi:GAF domain-containing protein